jgi:hypothetical protein
MGEDTVSKAGLIAAGAVGLTAALLVLSGCATTSPVTTPPPAQVQTQPQTPVPARPETPQAAPAPQLKPMADDQCGAQALQYLVGRPRTDIPVPLDPSMRRVVCSSCVVTQEYRADRQTITFNSDTGLITSVKCG